MIDYALVLRSELPLLTRIIDFIGNFDRPLTFNQSTHGSLYYEPTGVMVGIKLGEQQRPEAKPQLGIRLAAWFDRVASFAPLSSADAEAPAMPPFIPLLVVLGSAWELYFTFDRDVQVEMFGTLNVGGIHSVAVLRLLAGWVAGDSANGSSTVLRNSTAVSDDASHQRSHLSRQGKTEMSERWWL
ncbi:hypothetical protein MAPG_08848 [Magnaporthiopsis poae ATCC 64411]|uniref:PD-(D/E)XK nuclease-like domain-containing protein n=1 Tax=Magnaporthiopsis poae (strain ATCC 64411 / 73-15) TaxID=644358 RepID=A0A0C4E8E8_MAGP6|nr:hypothetical protein MAPG_08848 [Magnaporthiopsis poae ATCC 64411]